MNKILYFLFMLLLVQSCSMSKDDNTGVEVGEGGSLARFTILNDHLYIVGESTLSAYSLIDDNVAPTLTSTIELGFGTETIFPYDNHLLLGTQDGMYVFDLTNPSLPKKTTLFQHIRSCDPVVAEDGYAYITLNTSNQRCWRGVNELQIVDVHNLSDPYLKKSYSMYNPLGLDIHNDTLFVCDNGLTVLDVTDKLNPLEIRNFPEVQANDVIYTQGRLLVIGNGGFYQYSISPDGINKLSTLPVTP